jgi:hypothetical protein
MQNGFQKEVARWNRGNYNMIACKWIVVCIVRVSARGISCQVLNKFLNTLSH